jgi:predicted  nucleic acid-binding Zn-ribbon protein
METVMLTKTQFDDIKRIRNELQAYLETIQIVPLEDLHSQLHDAHVQYEDDFLARDEDWREATGGQKVEREIEELEISRDELEKAVDAINEGLRHIETTIEDLTKFLGE